MSMSLKRKRLSLEKKIDIIVENEKFGISARKLADKFGVGRTQVNEIIKNKSDLKKLFEEGFNPELKRKFPKTEGLEIDQIVYKWLCETRNKNFPISGPLIKEKALKAAESLNITTFKASNGWLEKFCQRHNIRFKPTCSKLIDVDLNSVEAWKAKLQKILKEYSPKNVYSADETELFYIAMSHKTFAQQSDKTAYKKTAKQRLTILFCVNMDGDKENPLIIGKSKNPRCFKGSHINKLPLEWVSNKKASMTIDIMTSWLEKFDEKMKKQNRKVLLFLDNAIFHPKIKLENVNIVFLPQNTTSLCQPLDQGIIHNFKMAYKKFLVRRLLSFNNNDNFFEDAEQSIDLTSTLVWISAAWESISPAIISKCFSKAGFLENFQPSEDFNEEDEIPLAQLLSNIQDESFENYASLDCNVFTENPSFGVQVIINELIHNKECDTNSESGVEELETCTSSIKDMDELCEKLRDVQNFLFNNDKSELAVEILQILTKCEAQILQTKIKNLKPTSIEKYF